MSSGTIFFFSESTMLEILSSTDS